MKKFILVLLSAGTVVSANAQLNSVLLFGDLNGQMNTTNNPGTKSTMNNFNFTPGVGYQVCERWTVGVEGVFNYSGNNTTSSGTTDKSYDMGYGGGVFARYTVPITPLFYFYTQADAVYTTTSSYADSKLVAGSTTDNFKLMLTPVIGLNIRNGYGLNFGFGGLGYAYSNNSSSKATSSNLTYSFGNAFTIGVSKNFIHHVRVMEKPLEDMGSGKATSTDSE